jgi:hypothetical protein
LFAIAVLTVQERLRFSAYRLLSLLIWNIQFLEEFKFEFLKIATFVDTQGSRWCNLAVSAGVLPFDPGSELEERAS